jgi:diguanylate cyclase (GGDEF)-like protein/PAS domain S-box-containing protein
MNISDQYFQKVLDNLYDGIYCLDKERKIIYWNKGAEIHTGYQHSEVIGRHCWDNLLMHVDSEGIGLCNDGLCPILKTIEDGCLREVEVYFNHKEGHRVPASLRIAPIKDLDNQVAVAVEIVTERSPKFSLRKQIMELQRLTLLDPLIEIGNRRYVEMNLRCRLEEFKRYRWQSGVLFIDIDDFKRINDTYGHDMGDRVLKMVGRTMFNAIRTFDFLGRWGGEEFISILVNVNKEQLYNIANRLRLLVEQSNISIGSETIHVTVSIGATLMHLDDTVDSLVKRVDRLMYNSKIRGKNCISMD